MYVYATFIQEKKPSKLKISLRTMVFGHQSGHWQSATEQMTEKELSQRQTLFSCIISIICATCYMILMRIYHQCWKLSIKWYEECSTLTHTLIFLSAPAKTTFYSWALPLQHVALWPSSCIFIGAIKGKNVFHATHKSGSRVFHSHFCFCQHFSSFFPLFFSCHAFFFHATCALFIAFRRSGSVQLDPSRWLKMSVANFTWTLCLHVSWHLCKLKAAFTPLQVEQLWLKIIAKQEQCNQSHQLILQLADKNAKCGNLLPKYREMRWWFQHS